MSTRTRSLAAAAAMFGLCGALASAGPIPPRKPAQVTLTLTGLSTFKGPLKGTCELDPVEHRVTVEGQGPNGLFLRLYVDNPSKAPFKVAMEGLGGGKGRIVGRVNSLVIDRNNYIAGAGTGALDTDAGTSGHLRAEGFIKAGATMQAQDLTASVTWTCQ